MSRGIALTGKTRPLNKHQLKTAAMRRRLMKSARRIFVRDGFEASRIEDIAAASGHTRGAFYAHFKSKEDLFFALLEEQIRENWEILGQRLGEASEPQRRLDILREYYSQRIEDRQWVMLLLEFKLFALRRPRLRPKLAEMHRRTRQSVKTEFVARLLIPNVSSDPTLEEPTRAALEGVLSGLVLESAFDPKRLSEAQVSVLLGRLFNFLTRDATPANFTAG